MKTSVELARMLAAAFHRLLFLLHLPLVTMKDRPVRLDDFKSAAVVRAVRRAPTAPHHPLRPHRPHRPTAMKIGAFNGADQGRAVQPLS